MSVLTYALHYEGEFNKNSLGAVSEGAKLAKELGAARRRVVERARDELTWGASAAAHLDLYRELA